MKQKKTLCIAGSMILPISVGEPAIIFEQNGSYRQTTAVINMKRLSKSVIRFETQNTNYLLHIISVDSKAVSV